MLDNEATSTAGLVSLPKYHLPTRVTIWPAGGQQVAALVNSSSNFYRKMQLVGQWDQNVADNLGLCPIGQEAMCHLSQSLKLFKNCSYAPNINGFDTVRNAGPGFMVAGNPAVVPRDYWPVLDSSPQQIEASSDLVL